MVAVPSTEVNLSVRASCGYEVYETMQSGILLCFIDLFIHYWSYEGAFENSNTISQLVSSRGEIVDLVVTTWGEMQI